MGVIAKGIPRGCQSLFTPVSLGYPLSVFNKNFTLKEQQILSNNFQFLNPLPTYKYIHFHNLQYLAPQTYQEIQLIAVLRGGTVLHGGG